MLDQLRELPPIRALRKRRYDRWWERRGEGYCRGIFDSFAEAAAAAPAVRPLGYDNAGAAGMYRERMRTVYAMDFPVLYWITRLYPGGMDRLFDFGGHVGLCWYAWRRHLEGRAVRRWTVLDVPAVVREGEALARQEGAAGLDFTTAFADASGADLLLANGALQYVDASMGTMLAGLAARPRHVIVNKLPTHASRRYVTLQHIGTAICPYRIAHAEEVPQAMAEAGYVELDRWTNPDLLCNLPFEPSAHPITYRGYCFARRE